MPRPEHPPNTKQRLLDAAEQLFAAQGAAATSLRAVTNAAGVNPAAVHYHFGSKQELLLAVARRRADPVNRERLKRLDDLESCADQALPLAQILDAFLRPEILDTELPMSAIFHHEPRETVAAIVPEVFGEVHRRFIAALAPALPHLEPAELDVRFHFVIGLMLHVLRGFTQMPVPGTGEETRPPCLNSQAVLAHLIDFSTAGLRAPTRSSL